MKWYVDRIIEAEHQDHIQRVLKVEACAISLSSFLNAVTFKDRVSFFNDSGGLIFSGH